MRRHSGAALAVLAMVTALDVQAPEAQQGSVSPDASPDAKPGERRQFLTCPIVRDTKTQPCWLAEYEGQLYYLGQQSGVAGDFYPPQLGHQALVEGTVGEGRVCGGIPLQPVKVSVMRELTPACDTILPAEDGIEAPPPVATPRGQAPSWVKVADPANVTLYFDFDNDFLSVHVTSALTSRGQARGRRESVAGGGRRLPRRHPAVGRPDADRARRTWAASARARWPAC